MKARLAKKESTIIVDARGKVAGLLEIKRAVHVPLSSLGEWAKTQNRKAFIVAYCACPHDETSEEAVDQLRQLGFEAAFSLKGGLEAARAAGLSLVPAPKDEGTH